ncbi:MAG TPA: hypothetical protein VJ785_17370, partial [Anaerolineales bacterium]|nr:hypothetical protein [Anaerolineales bacterium]
MPLLDLPDIDEEVLLSDECGVVIGGLIAERSLPLIDADIEALPVGEYQVKVQQGLMHFIDSNGEEYSTTLEADIRTIEPRVVDPPETIITIMDICYSWQHIQICTQPSPNEALTPEEIDTIQTRMQEAVDALGNQGTLDPEEINIEGTIPDVLGDNAAQLQQASVLAAPTVTFPEGVDEPVDGALLGVVVVLFDIEKEGYPPLVEGMYAVFAESQGTNEWAGDFVPVENNGAAALIPATYVEVRGEIEEPLAIVLDLRIVLC